MLSLFWRMIHLSQVPYRISASACRYAVLGLLGILLLSPVGARADTFYITFTNVTFSATCIGGGPCTEVINGSGLYDPVANTATGSLSLTGSLNASLIYGTPPQCTAPGCLQAPVLYDPNALPGFNPIEFFAALPTFDAPTPQPLAGGVNGALLFVPGMCGGDQPQCNTTGAFPGNGATDYLLASGTYTSVDVSTPEPPSLILFTTGAGILGLSIRRTCASFRSLFKTHNLR